MGLPNWPNRRVRLFGRSLLRVGLLLLPACLPVCVVVAAAAATDAAASACQQQPEQLCVAASLMHFLDTSRRVTTTVTTAATALGAGKLLKLVRIRLIPPAGALRPPRTRALDCLGREREQEFRAFDNQ